MIGQKIPQYHELMWPVLVALKELGGSATVKESHQRMTKHENFSEEQQAFSTKDSRMSEIEYLLHWARTYLKGIGTITNSARGVWTITDKGKMSRPKISRLMSRHGGLRFNFAPGSNARRNLRPRSWLRTLPNHGKMFSSHACYKCRPMGSSGWCSVFCVRLASST